MRRHPSGASKPTRALQRLRDPRRPRRRGGLPRLGGQRFRDRADDRRRRRGGDALRAAPLPWQSRRLGRGTRISSARPIRRLQNAGETGVEVTVDTDKKALSPDDLIAACEAIRTEYQKPYPFQAKEILSKDEFPRLAAGKRRSFSGGDINHRFEGERYINNPDRTTRRHQLRKLVDEGGETSVGGEKVAHPLLSRWEAYAFGVSDEEINELEKGDADPQILVCAAARRARAMRARASASIASAAWMVRYRRHGDARRRAPRGDRPRPQAASPGVGRARHRTGADAPLRGPPASASSIAPDFNEEIVRRFCTTPENSRSRCCRSSSSASRWGPPGASRHRLVVRSPTPLTSSAHQLGGETVSQTPFSPEDLAVPALSGKDFLGLLGENYASKMSEPPAFYQQLLAGKLSREQLQALGEGPVLLLGPPLLLNTPRSTSRPTSTPCASCCCGASSGSRARTSCALYIRPEWTTPAYEEALRPSRRVARRHQPRARRVAALYEDLLHDHHAVHVLPGVGVDLAGRDLQPLRLRPLLPRRPRQGA